MYGITSPMGGPSEVLWAPASEGSDTEMATFKCAAGAGLGTIMLGEDGDSSEARIAPCTERGGWVPARGRIGCEGKASGCDGTAVLGNDGWSTVRPDG